MTMYVIEAGARAPHIANGPIGLVTSEAKARAFITAYVGAENAKVQAEIDEHKPVGDDLLLYKLRLYSVPRDDAGDLEATSYWHYILATAFEPDAVFAEFGIPEPAKDWKLRYWCLGELALEKFESQEEASRRARNMWESGEGAPKTITGPGGFSETWSEFGRPKGENGEAA